MFARVATFNSLPEDLDADAVKRLRETVKSTSGYVAGYHLRDPKTGKGMSIVLVEEPSVGRAIAERLAERSDDERVGIEADSVEFFQVEPF